MLWILSVDPTRLKFVDETHFESARLHRRRALGPCNERVFVYRNSLAPTGSDERFTVTLITSINSTHSSCPCWSAVTYGPNDAVNFANILVEAVIDGYLQAGDVIVADNSKVCQSSFLTFHDRLLTDFHVIFRSTPKRRYFLY